MKSEKDNWMNKWKMLCINMTQMNPTKGDTELQDIRGTWFPYILYAYGWFRAIISDMGWSCTTFLVHLMHWVHVNPRLNYLLNRLWSHCHFFYSIT